MVVTLLNGNNLKAYFQVYNPRREVRFDLGKPQHNNWENKLTIWCRDSDLRSLEDITDVWRNTLRWPQQRTYTCCVLTTFRPYNWGKSFTKQWNTVIKLLTRLIMGANGTNLTHSEKGLLKMTTRYALAMQQKFGQTFKRRCRKVRKVDTIWWSCLKRDWHSSAIPLKNLLRFFWETKCQKILSESTNINNSIAEDWWSQKGTLSDALQLYGK